MTIWRIRFIFGTNTIHEMTMCCAPFPGEIVKDRVTWVIWDQGLVGHSKFLFCSVHVSVPTWPIRVTCTTDTTHDGTICSTPFPGQMVKYQGHTGGLEMLPCPLHGSVPVWPIRFIASKNTTPGVTMWCVFLLFRVFRSKVNVAWVVYKMVVFVSQVYSFNYVLIQWEELYKNKSLVYISKF